MKNFHLFISLGNFNNQAEYDAYRALPEEDTADEDYEIDGVYMLSVGYSRIVEYFSSSKADGMQKRVITRKERIGADYYAYSIAVNGKALIMSGPEFVPFTVVPSDNADGFEIMYRGEEDSND